MTEPTADRLTLMTVHAHPDDETISMGGTLATYAAAHSSSTDTYVVTGTRGELGEIVIPERDTPEQHAKLGETRMGEIAAAMAALGVSHFVNLGFRDSGMVGDAGNDDPRSFHQHSTTDLDGTVERLVRIIRAVHPDVLATYDEFGGYGHPDHIKAHRVAMYAYMLAAADGYRPELGAAWLISKVYWNANPRSLFMEGMQRLQAMDLPFEMPPLNAEEFQFLCDDDIVTTEIDGREYVDQKIAALREHRTQLDVDTGFFAAMQLMKDDAYGREFYRLVVGKRAGDSRENDLFAGIQ